MENKPKYARQAAYNRKTYVRFLSAMPVKREVKFQLPK